MDGKKSWLPHPFLSCRGHRWGQSLRWCQTFSCLKLFLTGCNSRWSSTQPRSQSKQLALNDSWASWGRWERVSGSKSGTGVRVVDDSCWKERLWSILPTIAEPLLWARHCALVGGTDEPKPLLAFRWSEEISRRELFPLWSSHLPLVQRRAVGRDGHQQKNLARALSVCFTGISLQFSKLHAFVLYSESPLHNHMHKCAHVCVYTYTLEQKWVISN